MYAVKFADGDCVRSDCFDIAVKVDGESDRFTVEATALNKLKSRSQNANAFYYNVCFPDVGGDQLEQLGEAGAGAGAGAGVRKSTRTKVPTSPEGWWAINPPYLGEGGILVMKLGSHKFDKTLHGPSIHAVIKDTMKCLSHMHHCSIVHGDIRGANIVYFEHSKSWQLVDLGESSAYSVTGATRDYERLIAFILKSFEEA